jgi:hypothetical protein
VQSRSLTRTLRRELTPGFGLSGRRIHRGAGDGVASGLVSHRE